MISLAQSVAQENLALRNGVRVNAVCPGAIETALTSGFFDVVPAATRMSSIRIGTPQGEHIVNVRVCIDLTLISRRDREHGLIFGMR